MVFLCDNCGLRVAFKKINGQDLCDACITQLKKGNLKIENGVGKDEQEELGEADYVSGQGKNTPVPREIQKWNWGAFFLSLIWGISHKVWVSLLILIPFVNIVMPFVLGAKGNIWAWQNKKWASVNHFQRSQKNWAIAGFIVTSIIVILSILSVALE